jgi:predicted MFS family arabinose efflux permease
MAFALVSLSLTARYLTLSTSLVPVLAAIGLWGVTAWSFFPAQQVRLMGITGLKVAPVIFSRNASFMYLGFSMGAALGALTLTHSSIADLGSVGGSCVAASLVL